MKPAPFQYVAPSTVDEALSVLVQHGYDAKLLAGGQSLVPTMNFRLAQPGFLIDLNRIPELDFVRPAANGALDVGAMTRQRTIERSDLASRCAPLLHAVMPSIAHVQIRNRGTIGGSLAHADPAAELPAVAVALDATLLLRNRNGERKVEASDFYLGLFTTDLAPDEMLMAVEFPPMLPRSGWGFEEFSRRAGDYAIAGCAAVVRLDESGLCEDVRLVYFSVGEVPLVAPHAAQPLVGRQPTQERIAEAALSAATLDIDPTGDIHASADYRRHLAHILARRVLAQAFTRAAAGAPE